MRKTIFIILSRIPYPLEKGDKLRAFYQIRELSKHHNLIICALSESTPHPDARAILKDYSTSLYFFRLQKACIFLRLIQGVFSRKPFQVAYFYNKRIHRRIAELIDCHQPDHIYCQLIRTAEYVRDDRTDKTIDYQDVFSAGLKRRANIAPWYMRPLLNLEYKRVRRYEKTVFDRFNKKTIISAPDRELIAHEKHKEITVVPNGVDTDYFKSTPMNKLYDVVFTGNMAYPPNINGATYLVREVMPHVWKEVPGARVAIAGATPSPAVKSLASEKVVVTGWVEDIREYYARSRIFAAPMQIGTGLQNKVLEAMAMGLPCITSPLANEALKASAGKEILIGRNPGEYAQHILSLLRDNTLHKTISELGHQFVLKNFNWENTSKILEAVIIGKDS